ncbi:hypothetical protein FVEN_g10404 [Fusarium venenatum]|nr:hypothetical protein FVEN_g10404 [Fusarium venenatum]
MPNIKVASEKRKRVLKVCNTCKTRKQKCDGLINCKNCRKRGFQCVYRPSKSTDSSSDSTASCSSSRHDLGEQSPEAAEHCDTPGTSGKTAGQYTVRESASPGKLDGFRIVSTLRSEEIGKYTPPRTEYCQQRYQTLVTLHLPLLELPDFSDCYSTESFVALVKQYLKLGSGSSKFTESSCIWFGPQQTSPASPNSTWPPDLPHIDISRLLVDNYFANTLGLINVVSLDSVQAIQATLHQPYNGPSQVCISDLCIIYLVLAIGLAFESGPTERDVQDPNLKKQFFDTNLKEQFFVSAEALLPPLKTYRRTESCSSVPWVLQALVLMSFYMLCVCRRHDAHSYCVQAFEIAHSFGIHRGKETEVESWSDAEKRSRRNVWRSLFVLDRLLAATLGKPLAINQYTDESLKLQEGTILNSAVDACRIIGETVKVVYSKPMTMKTVKVLIGYLDSVADVKVDLPALSVEQVRVDSFRIYADILLCRPFFLLRLIASREERRALDNIEPQINELSQRCVSVSIQAINMFKKGTRSTPPLPVDPFVPCVLIEATYVLLCSMYAGIHLTEEHLSLVKGAIAMLETVKKTNSCAEHSTSVLNLFLHDVNRQNRATIVKPELKGHAYESSQYRSPFYPPTQSGLVPPYDSRRRPAADDRNAIKQESHDHPNASASISLSPHMGSTFHHQPSVETPQHSWHNEHSGDMDLDGSQCERFK